MRQNTDQECNDVLRVTLNDLFSDMIRKKTKHKARQNNVFFTKNEIGFGKTSQVHNSKFSVILTYRQRISED